MDKRDNRFSILQNFLVGNHQSNILDIFNNIKDTKLFRDLHDLQELLDWAHRKGYVIKDINNKYTWIDKTNL